MTETEGGPAHGAAEHEPGRGGAVAVAPAGSASGVIVASIDSPQGDQVERKAAATPTTVAPRTRTTAVT